MANYRHTNAGLTAIGQQIMIVPLSIWLVLFAPLFCQFHGLLFGAHMESSGDNHSAMHHAPRDILCGEEHLPDPVPPASDVPIWNNTHQTMPTVTAMANLYLIALPIKPQAIANQLPARVPAIAFLPPTDPDLPVPTQPPRL
jgi:hypothetical protein